MGTDNIDDENIDRIVAILQDGLKLAVYFYPPMAFASPLISAWIAHEGHRIKTGIADGTIVPDGAGGFVPSTNSKYDPKTGAFL